MTEKRSVIWTENAVSDLLTIKEFISQDSASRARAWTSELYQAGLSLADFPERGRLVPEFDRKDLRELLIENYRLVYRIKKLTIEILTVFDGHRQLSKKDIKK